MHILVPFLAVSYRLARPETLPLNPTNPDEIVETATFSPRYEARERVRHPDDMMAGTMANRLVCCPARSGLVVMKAPQPGQSPATASLHWASVGLGSQRRAAGGRGSAIAVERHPS